MVLQQLQDLLAGIYDLPMQYKVYDFLFTERDRLPCTVRDSNTDEQLLVLDEGGAVWLVDFDRGSLRRPGLWCDSNLVRLRRSIEKITDALPAERFSEADWAALLNGYFIVPPARSAS